MIRDAIALTAGFVAGAFLDLAPVLFVRRIACRIKLNMVLAEIADVSDDIVDALREDDFQLAEGLTEFYTALCNERDALRVTLADLRPNP